MKLYSTCRECGTKKKSEFQTGIEPMASQTPGGCSTRPSELRELMVSKAILLGSWICYQSRFKDLFVDLFRRLNETNPVQENVSQCRFRHVQGS